MSGWLRKESVRLGIRGPRSNPHCGSLEYFFCIREVKPLMPILALLTMLRVCEKLLVSLIWEILVQSFLLDPLFLSRRKVSCASICQFHIVREKPD